MNIYTVPDLSNQGIANFSSDSRRMTYTTLDGNLQLFFNDGDKQKRYEEILNSTLILLQDGEKLTYGA